MKIGDHLAEAISMSAPGEKILLSAAIALGREIDDASARDWASWIADNRLRIFQEVVKLDEAERSTKRSTTNIWRAVLSGWSRTADGNLLTAAEPNTPKGASATRSMRVTKPVLGVTNARVGWPQVPILGRNKLNQNISLRPVGN
ncbi:hypothetical protein CK222_26965 [Mesorhizobium sp. WSM3866]|nr:hypothetical protein CK222_26965 [Mesorhizobium sp. WSM3866]